MNVLQNPNQKTTTEYYHIEICYCDDSLKWPVDVYLVRDHCVGSRHCIKDKFSISELWKKAEKAIRESSDIRGEIFIDHYTEIINARSSAFEGKIENLFRYVSELPKHTGTSRDDRTFRKPLYVSFKPLHDLDQRYPSVQKDV